MDYIARVQRKVSHEEAAKWCEERGLPKYWMEDHEGTIFHNVVGKDYGCMGSLQSFLQVLSLAMPDQEIHRVDIGFRIAVELLEDGLYKDWSRMIQDALLMYLRDNSVWCSAEEVGVLRKGTKVHFPSRCLHYQCMRRMEYHPRVVRAAIMAARGDYPDRPLIFDAFRNRVRVALILWRAAFSCRGAESISPDITPEEMARLVVEGPAALYEPTDEHLLSLEDVVSGRKKLHDHWYTADAIPRRNPDHEKLYAAIAEWLDVPSANLWGILPHRPPENTEFYKVPDSLVRDLHAAWEKTHGYIAPRGGW